MRIDHLRAVAPKIQPQEWLKGWLSNTAKVRLIANVVVRMNMRKKDNMEISITVIFLLWL